MTLRNRFDDRRSLLRLGMVALLLANLAHWYLRGYTGPWERAADGAEGVLFGIAIGTMLLYVRRSRGDCRPAAH